MIPRMGDDNLDALLAAARVVVDNSRQGAACYYQPRPGKSFHELGTNHNCALCRLFRALQPYSD